MPAPPAALSVRPLQPADLPAALAIQAEVYPRFLREGEEAFASRMKLASSYCLAATRGGTLTGYLLAHGWPSQDPPAVGTVLTTRPVEVLFIHDLAVSAVERGAGIGRTLLEHASGLAVGDGLRRMELIAVEGAAPYWRSLGFQDADTSADLARKVLGYGPEARWMSREA